MCRPILAGASYVLTIAFLYLKLCLTYDRTWQEMPPSKMKPKKKNRSPGSEVGGATKCAVWSCSLGLFHGAYEPHAYFADQTPAMLQFRNGHII